MKTNDLTQYNLVKKQLRAGDIIVFYGKSPLSRLIRLFADGPSHCAPVRQPVTDQGEDATVVQATIENGRNGVQTEPLGATIAGYGPVDVAALLLSDAERAKLDLFKFYQFIGECEDRVKYDVGGLFEFLLRGVPIIGERVAQEEKQNVMYCCAWATALLVKSGAISPTINWSKTRPQDLVEMGIYKDWVVLAGKPKLARFNTL